MKNILFWWGIFFALVFCIILSGMVAFGQDAAPVPIEFMPLVDLEAMFDPMKQWFTDILKEYWVMLLSIFFIWFVVMCGLSYLDGLVQRKLRERRQMIAIREKAALSGFERESKLEDYRRQLRESRYVERHEAEYRSRELQNIILRDGENFANVDGDYYVRSVSHGVVSYKRLDQWRAEVEAENSRPLDFDNDDHGRIYDSIVESDYRGRVLDDYMPNLPDPERYQSGDLELADESLTFEDRVSDEVEELRLMTDEEVEETYEEMAERGARRIADERALSKIREWAVETHGQSYDAYLIDSMDRRGSLHNVDGLDDFEREYASRERSSRLRERERFVGW